MEEIFFSVVIPVHNEEGTVVTLCDALLRALRAMGQSCEVILIDDGSTDGTRAAIAAASARHACIHTVALSPRQGQSSALQAGFDRARGRIIITMDGDFQNDPCDIPLLWNELCKGYDMVCGWRAQRKDDLLRKCASRMASGIRRLITRETTHDFGCSFRMFRRESISSIRLSGELHRFFTLLAARSGCRMSEVKITHHPRVSGKSKYNIRNRLVRSMIDFPHVLLSRGC